MQNNMEIKILLFAYLCCTFATALPTTQKAETEDDTNAEAVTETASLPRFASIASQKIAVNMLKLNADIDSNQVYSPLGISSILAILAEGAAGETYDEFTKALGFPTERAQLSSSFQRILSRYQNHAFATEPSFQTWLYIYSNNSARNEFKQAIRDNYFVLVKDINSDEYDWNEPNTSLDLETSSMSNSKDVIDFETLKRLRGNGDLIADTTETQTQSQSDTYGEEVINKAATKFDRTIDDKEFVEKPVILEAIKKEQAEKKKEQEADQVKDDAKKITATSSKPEVDAPNADWKQVEATDATKILKQEAEVVSKDINKREDDKHYEENETVHLDEKLQKHYEEDKESESIVPIKDVLDSNEPEKVTLPLQKLESALDSANKYAGEIMIALESHISSVRKALGARSLFRKEDIAHALSANSITGREISSKTKMLLFNGLYYAGRWSQPFFKRNADEDSFFFMTAEDAMKAPMMQSLGKFYVAELSELNAKVICLPYENKKYAMMIVLPNEIEGLRSLIDKLQPEDLKLAKARAQEKELRVIMPKFEVDETSRSESMLKSIGLKKLFTRKESDLSLLSDDPDLHVDEVVQFVSVRVNESGGVANALSASNPQARTSGDASELELIEVNRPFLYFIMDCEEEFVIAAGKIYNPEITEDWPVSIEVGFEKSSLN